MTRFPDANTSFGSLKQIDAGVLNVYVRIAATSNHKEGIHHESNQLLLAAILASATGTLIETLAEDKSVVQQMKRVAVQLPIEGELPSLGNKRRCDEL